MYKYIAGAVRCMLGIAVALGLFATGGVARADRPATVALDPLDLDVWPRPDGGVDGTLTMTWHAASSEPLRSVYKYLGHGSLVRAVTDPSGRSFPYTTTESEHEVGLTIAFDPPILPGETRTVILRFYQDHVWHYDKGGQQILLDMPWVGAWNDDAAVANEALRVHVPPEISSPPIAPGWLVDGQTLSETRKHGAASLSISFYAPRDAEARWTEPLVERFPSVVWLVSAGIIVTACAIWFLRRRRRDRRADISMESVGLALHPAAIAALVADHDEALIVSTCLMTLSEKGAIRLSAVDGSSTLATVAIEAIDLGTIDRLDDDERAWYESLFADAQDCPNGRRVADVTAFVRDARHHSWRASVERQLTAARLLQTERSPGLDGLSYDGWAVRESWQRKLVRLASHPPKAAPVALVGLAVALVLAGRALTSLDGYVETQSQQLLIVGLPVDGMPAVQLYNTIGSLIPMPPSHVHDFQATCNGTCGSGRFLGEHSCAMSGGGPGAATY